MAGRILAGEDLVFAQADGSITDPASITRSFARILKNAGLPHIRIHDLRHTHATLLLQGGVHSKVVSERLGHSSVAITLDIYSHVLPGLQEAAADSFDRILGGEPQVLGEVIPENSDHNVSKMLASGEGVECRPYRSRTCDTLIKSQVLLSLSDQSFYHVMLKPQQSPANHFCSECISNSVRKGIIWVGLSVPQGD